MSITTPVLLDNYVVEVSVDEGQKTIIEQSMQLILDSLRNYLQNDLVGINIKVVAAAPKIKYRTQREIIDDIRSRYPGVEALIQDFHLSLR